jgi:hypothetical protein
LLTVTGADVLILDNFTLFSLLRCYHFSKQTNYQ